MKDANDRTALSYASESGQWRIVQSMIKAGCEASLEFTEKFLNSWDKNHRTPLHYASINGNEYVVEALVKAGAKKDIKDKWKKQPIVYARENKFDEIIALLQQDDHHDSAKEKPVSGKTGRKARNDKNIDPYQFEKK